MTFKDNSEFATEEDYDFKALNYTRSWIIAGFIILAVAIALAAASVALPTFVMIAPSVFDASNANVNKARSMGYTQVCFTSGNRQKKNEKVTFFYFICIYLYILS
ncbi:unnamed protein product [Schistosoma mattheei]|uniref:Uncharacterized protein n=1 Tax=Schistosoma mattheei TaxID=31246 RepID=A0A183PTJ1_9TREM|nr:unnamed protein product [Schistosoma mattheei]